MKGEAFYGKEIGVERKRTGSQREGLENKRKGRRGEITMLPKGEWQNNMLVQLEEKVNFLNQQQQQQHIILQEIKGQNAKIMNLIKQSSSD